jgi:type VI secretion system protein ImpE
MNASELYRAGHLNEAIAAAAEQVKKHPSDGAQRGLLCELLCFAGDLERADKHLDLLYEQDPESAIGLSMFRQVIRAEQARRQFYEEGRLPEFLETPSDHLKRYLEASIRIREGDLSEAAALLDEAEEQRPSVPGEADGQPFGDIRDLDDLLAPLLEVLTSTGKYYWIPLERVELIEFRPPKRPRDLLWRRARMVVRGGPDGEVFLPALYAGSHAEADDQARLGRLTDWRGGADGPVRGVGQRTFLVGEVDRPVLELTTLRFTAAVSGPEDAEGA